MELTPEQVQLIKASWAPFRRVEPRLLADVFYGKLFLDHPALRKLFPKNMEEQYEKLLDMVNMIVARLEQFDRLSEDIAALGRRHVSYGVKQEHYVAVGQALLWTLQQGMGRDWQPELARAWTVCYGVLAENMISGSHAGQKTTRD